MRVPISWLRDFVDIEMDLEALAHRLTMAGLEVEEIQYVGLPLPKGKIEGRSGGHLRHETKLTGIEWESDKIVVGEILEVMPHPNADRLVLCRLNDGQDEHVVLTGAPNLFTYKGKGPLDHPLKVAYAREGAKIYDGHKPGQELMTIKRAKIRGVESASMACSEKELGISDDHEGVIILDRDAPTGMPLVDYMGDAVFDIAITPNIARNANILGVAREVAALSDQTVRYPSFEIEADGPPLKKRVSIRIENPQLNPRFVLGLIEGVEIRPSPYEIRRRLLLAGMRPINNIVDATNYAMMEVGQPLHAFDYDLLSERVGGKAPTIITRTAKTGERLTTLDGIDRSLDDFTVLVCDEAGALSIGGVIGGAETEVNNETRNVLLEGAAWNFINIRRTLTAQSIDSEASYRFSRGVHPAMAMRGVVRGLEYMRQWTGGLVSKGFVDEYPLPFQDPTVEVTPMDTERWLGVRLNEQEIADILTSLEFEVAIDTDLVRAKSPDHRIDIGSGIIGKADVLEEIARIYGYDRIPETRMGDRLPLQRSNPDLEREELMRDLLVDLGLQETINYRLTTEAKEARRLAPDSKPDEDLYIKLKNPITRERAVLRHSVLASVLENAERNARLSERIAMFEIGPAFFDLTDAELPEERVKIAVVMAGTRQPDSWQEDDIPSQMDFYDLKGIVQAFLKGLRIPGVVFQSDKHPSFHPGKCAQITAGGKTLGVIGELHPLVRRAYDLPQAAVLATEMDISALMDLMPTNFEVRTVPSYPPVLEDIAIVVDSKVQASEVERIIREAGGAILVDLQLFDVYEGEQISEGKRSLAFNLVYQNPERTLTDEEVAKVRKKIIKSLDKELGAKLRS